VRVLELLTYHTLLGALLAAVAGYALPGLLTRRTEATEEVEAAPAAATGAPVATAVRRDSVERAAVPAAVGARAPAEDGSVTGAHRAVDEEPTIVGAETRADRVGAPAGVDGPAETGHEPVSPQPKEGDALAGASAATEADEAKPAVIDRPTTSDRPTADHAAPHTTNGAAADDQRSGATSTENPHIMSGPATESPASHAAPTAITVRRRSGGLLSMLRR
jgi:hypothetical protein